MYRTRLEATFFNEIIKQPLSVHMTKLEGRKIRITVCTRVPLEGAFSVFKAQHKRLSTMNA